MDNLEFVQNARELIGLTYSICDCIGVVRNAANIRCSGTNWLWRSYKMSAKYRYLVERGKSDGIILPEIPGTLVFKISWDEIPKGYSDDPDCYHVGIIGDTGKTVIHSSPKTGVREEELRPIEWDGWGYLKQVDYKYGPSIPKPEPDPAPLGDQDPAGDRKKAIMEVIHKLNECILALSNLITGDD